MQTGHATLKLTPSLLSALRQCGHQTLWLRDHPERRRAFVETPASARGKAMHGALAEFHRMGGAPVFSPGELKSLLRFYWTGEGHADPEEERLALLQCETELEAYYERFGRDGGTLAVERSWSLLRDLDGLRTEWAGRMDWVRELPGGGLEVLDWKSGARNASPESLAADPITVVYGRLGRDMARRQMSWAGREVRFTLVFLGTAEKVSVQITREMVETAEAELARLARGLERGGLPAAEGAWCAWGGGCPVRAAGQCPLFPPAELDGEW
jgi:RecB family exonuclease